MAVSKSFDSPRLEFSPSKKPITYGFIGALSGPVLGLFFTFARVGPAGLIWFPGKGGETILTPSGRIIVSVIFFVGAVVGAFCGLALEARYRSGIGAGKSKSGPPQEDLWDREVDR
jgi:hypothetical protein